MHYGNGINGVYTPNGRRSVSPMRPPPLEPLVLRGFHDDTPVSARLLTPAVAEEIRIMIPERLRLEDDWKLVYSLDQDGASLSTLYGKCAAYEGRRGGFVLVIRDDDGGVSEQSSPFFGVAMDLLELNRGLILTHISSADIRRIPYRNPPRITTLLRHRRVLPLASLPPRLSSTAPLNRHNASCRPYFNHFLGARTTHPRPGRPLHAQLALPGTAPSTKPLDSFQGLPLQRRQRVLYLLRTASAERRGRRWQIRAVAGR